MVTQPKATRTDDGLVFRLRQPAPGLRQPAPVPIHRWAAQERVGAGIGVLLRLREDEAAADVDGDGLLVPWTAVAQLSEEELRDLGLPEPAPFALEVEADGSIHSPGFALHYGFVHHGRRILGAERRGAWLTAADHDYILLEPAYSIVEAIARYESVTGNDLEKRMLCWGEIAEQLPDEAIQDGHLRQLRLFVASAFEITPFVNEAGEPDLDPVLGRNTKRQNELGEEESTFEGILPAARQRDFAHRFRSLHKVASRYALPGNTFVVLTPTLRAALATVRAHQTADPAQRRAFLNAPSGEIRGALDLDGRDDVQVDDVFSEGALSERVTGAGLWQPKVLPWIVRPSQPWLPPEDHGLYLDGEWIQLRPEDLAPLRAAITEAQAAGRQHVVFRGHRIPATEETLAAIDRLRDANNTTGDHGAPTNDHGPPTGDHGAPTNDHGPPTEGHGAPTEGHGAPTKDHGAPTGGHGAPTGGHGTRSDPRPRDEDGNASGDQVLIILDNLESVNFRRARRQRSTLPAMAEPWLRSSLLPHQRECVAWLRRHWETGSCGALLADDMGLGKTFSALAFLRLVQEGLGTGESRRGPVLVVAPTGLLKNWEDEHDRRLEGAGLGVLVRAHGPGLRALRLHGDRAARQREGAAGQPSLDLARLEAADWVLTTYETLRDHQHSFGRVRWRAGVFDEAQKIKNPGARVTEAVLAMNLDFVLLMTGTPVENRPADIWSLLDRAEPGLFGTLKAFSERYESERDDGGEDDDGDERDDGGEGGDGGEGDGRDGRDEREPTDEAPSALADLNARLTHPMRDDEPALMLRRLKEDHLASLPEKTVYCHTDDMPPTQADAYARAVREGRGQNGGGKGGTLAVLNQLRRISLHPRRFQEDDLDRYIGESARLARCFAILDNVRRIGEKALVFVESRDVQSFLLIALRRRYSLPDDVLLINGTVAGDDRKRRVDAFQQRNGFDAMVLSPRAGGVGLTLTRANHVIHLSRWWNPAVEDQCTDRIFRIGQVRPVHIHLPMARHPVLDEFSFDLRLNALMDTKRDRNRRVLAPVASSGEDLDGLFRATVEDAPAAAGE